MEQTSEATGETEGRVVVDRIVPRPVKAVWDALMSSEGAEALLGPGAQMGAKGHTWQSHDGRQGVIRSFHPLEQIRFSWRIKEPTTPTMVSVDLTQLASDSTRIAITHSQLTDDVKLDWIKDRWTAALDRIESECL